MIEKNEGAKSMPTKVLNFQRKRHNAISKNPPWSTKCKRVDINIQLTAQRTGPTVHPQK
jgi:predicted RNA methylase